MVELFSREGEQESERVLPALGLATPKTPQAQGRAQKQKSEGGKGAVVDLFSGQPRSVRPIDSRIWVALEKHGGHGAPAALAFNSHRATMPTGRITFPPNAMKTKSDTDLLPEYDFSGGVRGKYVARLARGNNVVVLARDVQRLFPDSVAVNTALRALGVAVKAAGDEGAAQGWALAWARRTRSLSDLRPGSSCFQEVMRTWPV